MPLEIDVRAASLDGDADRLVYYYLDKNETFRLLDGDKIATLSTILLKVLIIINRIKILVGSISCWLYSTTDKREPLRSESWTCANRLRKWKLDRIYKRKTGKKSCHF